MSKVEGEKVRGPHLESENPSERIAARRERMKRRKEIAKRQEQQKLDASAVRELEDTEEESHIEQQTEESRQRLDKLFIDGHQLVTNVSVAAGAREAARRAVDTEVKRKRQEELQQETEKSVAQFQNIAQRWQEVSGSKLPRELHGRLMEQKALCDELIEIKNALIHELEGDLKSVDDRYVKDLRKYDEEVSLLAERVEDQVQTMRQSYKDELRLIEVAAVRDRQILKDSNERKWESLLQQRETLEKKTLKKRLKRPDDQEMELRNIHTEEAEEYRQMKIKLETDIQVLEQQLQQMKAVCMLNTEKLDYNFQVLKKRDEENTITKSQQKRKITRLQDIMNNLKCKLMQQEKILDHESQQLGDDLKRLSRQLVELQTKAQHFALVDRKRFNDVWDMTEETATALLRQILDTDHIIHEQHLGLEWKAPDLQCLSSRKQRMEATKKKSAMEVATKLFSQDGEPEEDRHPVATADHLPKAAGPDELDSDLTVPPAVLRHILQLLVDQSGFLVEERLQTLLAPLEKNEQALIKLDSIFNALGLNTEEDIRMLSQYFLKYSTPTATENARSEVSSPVSVVEPAHNGTRSPSVSGYETISDSHFHSRVGTGRSHRNSQSARSTTSQAFSLGSDAEGDAAADEEVDQPQDSQGQSVSSDTSETWKREYIHPTHVLKALREFMAEFHKKTSRPSSKTTPHSCSPASVDSGFSDPESIQEFWDRYSAVLPADKEHLWEGLLQGLEKYNKVLSKRIKLISDTGALRQQNAELRKLLRHYINSKVNDELVVPPTRVIGFRTSELVLSNTREGSKVLQ